jgi:hypothetical protein
MWGTQGFAIQADAGLTVQADAPLARVAGFAPLSLTPGFAGDLTSISLREARPGVQFLSSP